VISDAASSPRGLISCRNFCSARFRIGVGGDRGGGVSVWARLPDGSSAELAQVAHRHGVLIAPGSVMSSTGRSDEFIRLPFDHDTGALREGIRRLASAWRTYRGGLDSDGSSQINVIV
jgi:aspartate/methionine/tyrosine aminotransferase